MMLGMGQDQVDLSQYYAQFGATDVIPGSDILRMSLDNEGYLTNAAGTVVGRLDDSGNLVPAATYSVTGTDKAPATPITQVPPAATPCKQTIFKDIKGFCDTYLWIGLATLGGMLLMKGRR